MPGPSAPFPQRCAAALVLAAAAAGAGAHGSHAAHADAPAPSARTAAAAPTAAPTRVRLSDVRLVDQDGHALHLGREVIGSRIAVVDFVYASCTTVCPLLSATLAGLQPRLGDDVRLVSITLDPAHDTPARLKERARQHGAGPGWRWLTGDAPAVDEALRGFGAYGTDFTRHPPMVLVGDASGGRWTRFVGLPDPGQILAAVEALRRARAAVQEQP